MKVMPRTVTALALVASTASAAFMPAAPSSRFSPSMMAATLQEQETVVAPAPSFAAPAAKEEETSSQPDLVSALEKTPVAEKPEKDAWFMDPKNRVQPGRYNDKPESIALPFLKRPTQLDGSHAGDFGFDPLGLTEPDSGFDLYAMQEAELRHARLAMLAVVGWPLSELAAPSWMLQDGCAPSVLNGFNPVSFLAVALAFGAAGFGEYKTALRRVDDTATGKKHYADMELVWSHGVAGDYNFDPLDLYSILGDDASARKGLREVEISHGRMAMLGITGFATWEALTGAPIVDFAGGIFFHPNMVLPALAGAYLFGSSIYELDEEASEQYLRFKMSSEGEARLENLSRNINNAKESNKVLLDAASVATEKALELAETAMDYATTKYEESKEDYTASVMKNIK